DPEPLAAELHPEERAADREQAEENRPHHCARTKPADPRRERPFWADRSALVLAVLDGAEAQRRTPVLARGRQRPIAETDGAAGIVLLGLELVVAVGADDAHGPTRG